MSRAICIPYHRSHPHKGDYYRTYFDYFKKVTMPLIASEFDSLYLIDSDHGFDNKDIKELKDFGVTVTILPKKKDGQHWVHFKDALPEMHREDYVLFLDSDVIFYKQGVIDAWFKAAEGGKALVTAFDGSGGLKNVVQSAFPPLKAMDVTRMGSYYFVANKNVRGVMADTELAPIQYTKGTHIDELQYITQEGDWSDSFGFLTIKLFGLGVRTGLIYDDRSSIYLSEDHKTTYADYTNPANLGYYHLRNGSLPIHVLTSFKYDTPAYKRCIDITPERELLRLLSFYDLMQKKLGGKFSKDIEVILNDLEIAVGDWNDYLFEVEEFHRL